jgi:hypothetical protein
VAAYGRGQRAVIEVEDDGAGIDLPAVRESAARVGMLPADEAEMLDESECLEMLFRAGFTIYMIEMTCQIAYVLLFYELLKPVNRSIARTAMVLGLTGCGIKTVARLFYYAPLLLLGDASFVSVFGADQLQAFALSFLRVNDQGAAIALIFFGFESALEGWLIIRSTFLPRLLGVLGVIGGLGWLTFLWPPLGYQLFTFVALFALVASIITIGWLFVRGVDEARWNEQAALAAASMWR